MRDLPGSTKPPLAAGLGVMLGFALASPLAAQNTAVIQCTLLDAKTAKPIPAAWVDANRAGAPPFSRHTKSGGDGSFTIQGLAAGKHSLCVQAAGDAYLNPCEWSGTPTTVTLLAGQTSAGNAVRAYVEYRWDRAGNSCPAVLDTSVGAARREPNEAVGMGEMQPIGCVTRHWRQDH